MGNMEFKVSFKVTHHGEFNYAHLIPSDQSITLVDLIDELIFEDVDFIGREFVGEVLCACVIKSPKFRNSFPHCHFFEDMPVDDEILPR